MALSNRMFVDVILLNVFFDIILQDELEIFCWPFELFIFDLLIL